ncbi:ankyrin repeat-containing protein BDA1-like [Impatiens glandulifera]|uniref:ankyrin repeat-containing protein BDA1-like n=1 Tax=Impatiens glandulifera TaxID=253017 RepID=UPI001FB08F7A|nr:ankyrin repeat-containing protein BDA1-like [Impatiens glandulifera]
MDKRRSLIEEAAWTGDLTVLKRLAKEDPRSLHSPSLLREDNPLHIGCMASHHDFVKELIILNRKLAYDLNEDGLSPLHIAAANGDFNIVKELVVINNMVLVEGKDRCIPLHCAVIKGRLDVVNLLIETDPDSIEKATAQGETVLHLAIKNNQFKTLQILLDQLYRMGKLNLLENKDDQGNTILHLATSRKQYEVINFLLCNKHENSEVMVDVNAMNLNGQTPLDVLLMHNEMGDNKFDKRMEDILLQAGAKRGPNQSSTIEPHSAHVETESQTELSADDITWYTYFKYKEGRDSPGDVRNCLLVIVALITTATYQAILSPPGGAWQDSSFGNGKPYIAGRPIMQTYSPVLYGFFLYFNTAGFCASVYMIHLLTAGFPLKFELNTALGAIVITYEIAIAAFTPKGAVPTVFLVFSMIIPITMPYAIGFYRGFFSALGIRCMGEPSP